MSRVNQAMSDLLSYNAALMPRKRSRFDKSHNVSTTLDSGYLVPLSWDRVVPGDEKEVQVSALLRMTTPIHPVMDSAFFHTWAFYVPDRLWWEHAREFYGENKYASFNPDGEYVMPYLKPSQYALDINNGGAGVGELIGSLTDYLGFPAFDGNYIGGTLSYDDWDTRPGYWATAGLHRSYHLIWNEFFRNSSVQPYENLNFGDTVSSAEWNVIRHLKRVNKYPDYFTTALREPQAGESVVLPLGDWAPVVTRAEEVGYELADLNNPLRFAFSNDGAEVVGAGNLLFSIGGDNVLSSELSAFNTGSLVGTPSGSVHPNNLWARLTDVPLATINNLRSAITIQQLLEIDARAGKRYQQLLYAHFGVLTPDGTLQRPLLLGASKTPVGVRQVLQTSSTDSTSPLGSTAAVSVTSVDSPYICNQSFTEPGFIIVLGAVRVSQSYSQGLNPLLTKLNRYDHYYPVFDNIGNQPIYDSELYFSPVTREGDLSYTDDDVFGYKEAWSEYRILPNRVTGLFRPDVDGSLSSWNYSSYFPYAPVLDSSFIQEPSDLVERTLAVQNQPQFLLDCWFDYKDTKNMSVHSIPGLTRL